jgi:eukaryotic-like serine/threonine-protein kinase
MVCKVCETNNSEGARFCCNCGGALAAPTVSPQEMNRDREQAVVAADAPAIETHDDELTHVRTAVPRREPAAVVASSKPSVISAMHTKAGDLLIGRIIEGKYRIDAKLGAGGMGAVYSAHRLLIGDEVAVKILHPEHVSEPQASERFRREAQAAARLKHPNAVSIYDFGITSDGLVYLVMELVEGQSLRRIIKQQGPLTPSAAADVINQVCAALDEAHRQHIVHRDLKPDNIIVHPTVTGLRVKVLDFGIAKLRDMVASNLTQTGSVMGTPHYMSPEQCLGEELDSRSDIYSLGIVLYEMLAGVVPFNSPTSTAVVVQHVNQTPPSLRTINLSISQPVEAVVLHALAKKREERPQTATALAQEMNAAVHSGVGTPSFAPAQNHSFGSAQPPAPSGMMPTVVLKTPVSGSSAPYPDQASPFHGVAPMYAPPTQAGKRTGAIFASIGGLVVIGLAIFIYFAFFSFSAKKTILAEIKKGNLVKPQGNSGYDLFLKYKGSDLKKEDIDEIARTVVSPLEQRGDSILNNLKTEQIESEDEWVEATRIYTWLNELRPNSVYESKIYFSQGSLAFAKKDFNASLTSYQRTAKLQPNWSLVLNRLGRAYLNLKDKSSAREYYRQATVAEPGWISPWVNLGAICLDLNDPYSAEPALRQAIGIDSQKASAHNLLGQALEKQTRLCEALDEYSTAVELASNTPTPTVNVDAVRKKITAISSRGITCGE